jgi:hypothetical protein
VKPPLRTKSVGTKVSDAEFAVLEERVRAAGLTLSEWVREVLLAAPAEPGAELTGEVVLAELLALRSLFLNLHFRAAKGEPVPEAEMRGLIERADGVKIERARERLEAARAAQQQSSTSSTSTTGTTAQDHYVSIGYWPTGAGGFGHIGVQVDSDDTQGYSTKDPSIHWWQRLFGAPAARTEDDIAQHTTNGDTATHFYHHISITADQATQMQGAMAARTANPGHYNLLFNNCACFVESALRSGGVWAPHAEIFGPPVLYGILSLEH